MCGIAGFWVPDADVRDGQETVRRMTDAIRHRGPDADGHWVDEASGVHLGHRRLSILDLSPAGAQPMVSASGRFVITFNGEIYNFRELRHEVESAGTRFRGHSDTEVLLAAFERWGITPTLRRSAGMFALAVWDSAERELTLARDRIGEKPLYYGWCGRTLLFGSELKALRAYRHFHGEIDRDAVAVFLRHNYIPAPHSIYKQIRKVVPGTVVTVRADRTSTEHRYWSMAEVVEHGAGNPFRGTEADAADELERVLLKTIGQQMIADVPLGAFLSGGVDSSLVVALMQQQSAAATKTFTIKFDEPRYDESGHARAVAKHLGTDHTELTVTAAEARSVIPALPAIYDEPFSDSSQIPTYLVSKVARSRVTVSLSGDGGDEMFAGYTRYDRTLRLWGKLRWSPTFLRLGVARALTAVPAPRWDALLRRGSPAARANATVHGDRIHKLAAILAYPSLEATYRRFVTHWPNPSTLVQGATEAATVLASPDTWPDADPLKRLTYLDSVSYLPDDIFVKVDRAAMAISLETRAPFVDPRVVELSCRIPSALHYRDGRGKLLLRRILRKYVPDALIERPKMGFGIPLEEWLRGPLREWGEALLAPARLAREGFFNPAPIREKWEQHQRGERRWHYHLWDVLMFQAWLEQQ